MMTEKPTSFKIFIAVIIITALVFLIAAVFSCYQVDKKYSMILAFFMFVASSFTTIGIYTGVKYRIIEGDNKIQNRIGLIGNLLIFIFTVGLMAFAALTTAS